MTNSPVLWAVDPEIPEQQYGPSWVETHTVEDVPRPGGWFALVEKLAQLSGEGSLNVATLARKPVQAHFSADGTITVDPSPRHYRDITLSSDAFTLWVANAIRDQAVGFSSDGRLTVVRPDGLSFDVTGTYPAYFTGGGGLSTDVSGGSIYHDGLNVFTVQQYLVPGIFDSIGELMIFAGSVGVAFPEFTGDGSLTLTREQIYDRLLDLSGSGALSATTIQQFTALANLLGSGTLSADAFSQFLTSVGVSGVGALTALAIAAYASAPATASSGTISLAILQKYLLDIPFSGGGTIAVESHDAGFPDGLSVRCAVGYPASLSGAGALSVTATGNYAVAASFSGSGLASATADPTYIPRSASLSGSGTLSATATRLHYLGFADGFNRADDFTQIGNGWTPRNGALGVYLNGAVPLTAAVWNEASAPVAMDSDDMEVSITLGTYIGTPATGDYATILLGMNAVGEGVFVFMNGGAGITIYTQADWALTGLTAQASIAGTQTTGDKFTARRVGNVYTILKNGASTGLSWTDSTNIIPRDANHRQVGVAAYTADAVNARVIDSFDASTSRFSGGGTLSATATQVPYPTITNITTSPFIVGNTITITGTGFVAPVTVTVGGVAATSVTVGSSTSLTCVIPSVSLGARNVIVTAASGASAPYSITIASAFTPFNEENTSRVNQTVPAGTSGVWVTLIGTGGAGGTGRNHGGIGNGYGGGGGGGGGYIPRTFIPVASLGSTYSLTRASGPVGIVTPNNSTNGSAGGAGTDTVFSSGSTVVTAGRGGPGGGGTNGAGGAAGTGGAVSGATGDAGTAGGAGALVAGAAGTANGASASGGAGGGGGGGSSSPRTGGAGGNSNGQTGGAGGAGSTGPAGSNGGTLTAGVAGAGGGGGGGNGAAGNGSSGGAGIGYGSGGGAAGDTAVFTGGGSFSGAGGPGYSKLEWV